MIKEILLERKFKAGYIIRHELRDGSEFGCDDFVMKSAYTHKGDYIGTTKEAHFLCVKRGLTRIQKTHHTHCVCSIGFDEAKQKWVGWSHRAICSFGIGDRIFEEEYGNDHTPFIKHGSRKIKTLGDAKLAARRFAEYVS
jgi:hypothetical protein